MKTDEQLIEELNNGNELAESELLLRYKFYVMKMVRRFYLVGGDMEDLIQEGMIGLYRAIKKYQTGRNATFKTFAITCIKHQLQGAISKANSKKHKVLSEAVSFHNYAENDTTDGNDFVFDTLTELSTPVDALIDKENFETLKQDIKQILSPLEEKVFDMYLQGYKLNEISQGLNTDRRGIENALARVRCKLKKQLR